MNSDIGNVETTPELEIICLPAVARAAVGLVAIKDEMDYLGRALTHRPKAAALLRLVE